MGRCKICERESKLIADWLGLCRECIYKNFSRARAFIERAHCESRREFNLPEVVPKDDSGVVCPQCGNRCRIGNEQYGFCGLKKNQDGRLKQIAGTPTRARLEYYYDALPTNCVASWVCPEGDQHATKFRLMLRRKKNLAVFYAACTFNCLFCQNWHFRYTGEYRRYLSAEQLADAIDPDTNCVCYFGGDPSAQITHAIATSRIILSRAQNGYHQNVRICWETNGSMSRPFIKKMMELSLTSGGCIKFDLKAFDYRLNYALTGVSNTTTLSNFIWLAENILRERTDPPPLVASTLLIPGYVTQEEVYKIARFIARLNPEIPYSLLGFHPQFYFNDLPITSRRYAEEALAAARDAGLRRVHIGNRHLLIHDDYY